jgi:hypothetical protein
MSATGPGQRCKPEHDRRLHHTIGALGVTVLRAMCLRRSPALFDRSLIFNAMGRQYRL